MVAQENIFCCNIDSQPFNSGALIEGQPATQIKNVKVWFDFIMFDSIS